VVTAGEKRIKGGSGAKAGLTTQNSWASFIKRRASALDGEKPRVSAATHRPSELSGAREWNCG
jgi:hypothetical protein